MLSSEQEEVLVATESSPMNHDCDDDGIDKWDIEDDESCCLWGMLVLLLLLLMLVEDTTSVSSMSMSTVVAYMGVGRRDDTTP